MSWEKRGNNRYYYRKYKAGGQVVSEYIGTGSFAEYVAANDEAEREIRQAESARFRQERRAADEIDQQINKAIKRIRLLTQAVLLTQGYHTYKRQWRKIRNEQSD